MKLLIVLALFALAAARPDGDTYNLKYESVDVDDIVSNDRLLKAYGHCFLGDGKCTPEGSDISKTIPDAISTTCAKCTPKHRTIIAKFLKGLKTKFPELHESIYHKHDAEGKFASDYNEFIQKYSA